MTGKECKRRLVGPSSCWVKVLLLLSSVLQLQMHRFASVNGYEGNDETGQQIITAIVDGDMGVVAGANADGEDQCPPCLEDHCAVCASMIDFTCCVDPINNITSCVRGGNETAPAENGGCPAEFCACGGGSGSGTGAPSPSTTTTAAPTISTATPSPAPPVPCADGEMEVVISILTDPYPREIHWNITNSLEEVVASVRDGELQIPDHSYETRLCLSRSDDADDPMCYGFTIGDTGGDGICCVYGLGEYTLEVDGSTVAEGGEFEYTEEIVHFGECDGSGGGNHGVTSSPSQSPSSSSSSFSSQPDGGDTTNSPTGPPSTSRPTKSPTSTPTSAEPSQSPSPEPSSKDPTPAPSGAIPTRSPASDPTAQPTIADGTPQPTDPNRTPPPSPTPEPGSDLTPQPSLSAKPITKGPTAQPTTPAPRECPGDDEMSVLVFMRTDRYPQESSWKITDRGQDVVVASSQSQFGNGMEEETHYNASMCLDGRDCYEFVIEDSFGDGLCCEFGTGSYSLHVDGNVIAEGGEFKGQSDEPAYFGRCCNGATEVNVGCEEEDEGGSTETPTAVPTTPRPTLDPTSQPTSSEPSPNPTPRPTSSPQSTATTAEPSQQPPPDCDASEMMVTVSLTTDRNPWENYWEITNDGSVVATSGDHIGSLAAETRHDVTICLPRDACYSLVVVDIESDGLCCKWGLGEYSIAVDGEVVGSGAKFEQNDITQFGKCCSGTGLETTFVDNNGSGGNMFDVMALTDVTIEGFDIHTIVNGSGVEAEVYTKAGSYRGHEQDEAAWTLVMSTRKVRGRGMGVGTTLGCLDTPVSVAVNSTQAFYVTATSSVIRYTNLNRDVVAVKSNDDIKVSMGCGNEYKFGSSFQDRAWNGILRYTRG